MMQKFWLRVIEFRFISNIMPKKLLLERKTIEYNEVFKMKYKLNRIIEK